ncbi:two-component sensor histidine kinase [Aliidiomarina sedimenti]|uniref:histidine kinase n=1 Tax=Aliidiomarina sedimenti TaxID=1933879 RepID=A0ABY0BX91_9GAMM|nr:ATP-binding protein [Aliidiomarina sedimenti]RUO28971.1 two-component sensor histidine kinase [Aliidiomarina sedimenti]
MMKRRPLSIQGRLLISLLGSFVLVWSVVSVWLLLDLQTQMRHTLDQRLAATARVVAGVLDQLPEGALNDSQLTTNYLTSPLDGVACQVRWQSGELVLRTADDMASLLDTPQSGFSQRNFEGTQWRLFTLEHRGMVITTADRMSERDALYQGVLIVVAGPVLIALIGMLLATWWGIKRGLKPLLSMGQALKQRRPEALEPIQLALPQEIEPVLSSLNQLLERVATLVRREQRFTADAAHELRTPLTAIKTNLQLATRLPQAERNEVLLEANAAVERMQQVIDQLLVLARLDADEMAFNQTSSSAGEVIELAIADIDDLSRLEIAGDLSLRFPLDSATAAMALRNLIDNALSYAVNEQVSSPVEVRAIECGDCHCLVVRDYGPGMKARDMAQATERFWRANHTQQGSGLGLAIVEQICAGSNGQLVIEAANPGLQVRLCWPVA